jgi:hypothetical protein
MTPAHKLEAVTICPGPNLAHFSRIVPLRTMVDHIYGRTSLLNTSERPHMFINELKLYVEYLRREFEHVKHAATEKQRRYIETFKANLLEGIRHYENLTPELQRQAKVRMQRFTDDLLRHALEVRTMLLPAPVEA